MKMTITINLTKEDIKALKENTVCDVWNAVDLHLSETDVSDLDTVREKFFAIEQPLEKLQDAVLRKLC